MSKFIVSEEVLLKIIRYLYLKATTNEAQLTVDLSRIKFSAYDKALEKAIPEVIDRSNAVPKVEYAAYILKMEELGWISRGKDWLSFTLTQEGFKQGAQVDKTKSKTIFSRLDWKFWVVTCIAFVTLIYTALAYYSNR
ncbi:hypothetical protein GCS57_003276 [Vibrio cholerae]|uniref:hypothetical protein n=1 Tax=Vibrio cholerae TaxID=666 RepID=UPI0034DA4CE9|nr:hypothetical protein [Vibrio cholerae]